MSVVISSSLILSAGSSGFPLTHARILYENLALPENVTGSSSAAAFPAEDAARATTYDGWKPASLPAEWTVDNTDPMTVNAVGIGAHNFGVTGPHTVAVEHSDDGLAWTEAASVIASTGDPVLFLFDDTTAQYWRVTLDGGDPPFIGVIYMGQALAMQRAIYGGHAPAPLSRSTDIVPSRSEGGQWLGRSIIRKGVTTSYQWRHLKAAWYRQYFDPFVKSARTTPFFIAWRPETYPNEVAYAWTKSDIRPSNMGIRDFMEVTVSVEGLTDE